MENLDFYKDLAEEFKNSWEEAEKDVDILTDENLELKQTLNDLRETIMYYEDILKRYREKLITYKNEN